MGSAGGFALLFGIGIAIWMACVLLIFFALRKKFSTGKPEFDTKLPFLAISAIGVVVDQ
jgi:hypothetical protein